MERKLVTVLFAHAIGSTSLADGLDPEPLRTVLDAYFNAMAAAVDAWGGTEGAAHAAVPAEAQGRTRTPPFIGGRAPVTPGAQARL